MNTKLRITETSYPAVPNCQNCGSFFIEKAVRVQRQSAQNKKLARTIGTFCQSCARTLGYVVR